MRRLSADLEEKHEPRAATPSQPKPSRWAGIRSPKQERTLPSVRKADLELDVGAVMWPRGSAQ